jgi:hypothetical protein
MTRRGYKGSGARSATQQNKLRLPHTPWWEKRLQAVLWPTFCNLNACRGTVIGGVDGRKWAFLYLIVVVVLMLSYSADLSIIKLPSVALPVMHLRTVAD